MQRILTASIKCATNQIVSCIPSYTVRHIWYRHVLGWYLGPNAAILMGQHVSVKSLRRDGKRVSIGAGTVIDHDCLIYTAGGLLMGEDVYISPGVWLVTESRDVNDPAFAKTYAPIVIDDHAWIGPRAIILGGVTIGRGAVVQAGALVATDLAPNCVVGGVPAQVIDSRKLRNPAYSLKYRPLFS